MIFGKNFDFDFLEGQVERSDTHVKINICFEIGGA